MFHKVLGENENCVFYFYLRNRRHFLAHPVKQSPVTSALQPHRAEDRARLLCGLCAGPPSLLPPGSSLAGPQLLASAHLLWGPLCPTHLSIPAPRLSLQALLDPEPSLPLYSSCLSHFGSNRTHQKADEQAFPRGSDTPCPRRLWCLYGMLLQHHHPPTHPPHPVQSSGRLTR